MRPVSDEAPEVIDGRFFATCGSVRAAVGQEAAGERGHALLDDMLGSHIVDAPDIARVIGMTPRSVARWATTGVEPRRQHEERLLELEAVGDVLPGGSGSLDLLVLLFIYNSCKLVLHGLVMLLSPARMRLSPRRASCVEASEALHGGLARPR